MSLQSLVILIKLCYLGLSFKITSIHFLFLMTVPKKELIYCGFADFVVII